MSLSEKFAELYELLIGLGVAAVVLAIVAWFIGGSWTTNRSDNGIDSQPSPREPVDEESPDEDQLEPTPSAGRGAVHEPPEVAALFIAPGAGKPMRRIDRANVVARRGFVGDRYFLERGHWSGTDDCEVTIIAQADLDDIEARFDIRIQNGEHRRNMVIRNLPVEALTGKRFHIGSASFGYERPRPPCAYIQTVSEPGMTKALGRRAGICVRCIKSGVVQEGDRIIISDVTLLDALKYRAGVMLRRWQSANEQHR